MGLPKPLPFAVCYGSGTGTLFLSVHPEEKEILSCRCAGVTADDGGAPGGPGSGQQSAPGDEMNGSVTQCGRVNGGAEVTEKGTHVFT